MFGGKNNNDNNNSKGDPSRLVYGKDDALFGAIEEQQGNKPFGNVLDAGTGIHSMRWICTLPERGMTSFTAITADESMQQNVQREVTALVGEEKYQQNVLIGNWFPSEGSSPAVSLDYQLQGQTFDTILADYLIGAMDGFSPYCQDQMITKLAKYLKPGGRLYIVGLEPIPDSAPGDANIICKVREVRDACILLAGHRCYREYPVDWIIRQLERNNDDNLQLLHMQRFPILYRQETVVKQINVARSKLKLFPSPDLSKSMGKLLDDLENQSQQAMSRSSTGRIQLGFDYVVAAEKKS